MENSMIFYTYMRFHSKKKVSDIIFKYLVYDLSIESTVGSGVYFWLKGSGIDLCGWAMTPFLPVTKLPIGLSPTIF